MNINEQDIQRIIQEVIRNVEVTMPDHTPAAGATASVLPQSGVYDRIEDAIDAACEAQRTFATQFRLKDRELFINAIREACRGQIENLARMVREETKLGRFEDKVLKHQLVVDKTPGPEDLQPTAISGDEGLTLVEYASFGVIGAITPVTNPTFISAHLLIII